MPRINFVSDEERKAYFREAARKDKNKHPERVRSTAKKWRENNPDKIDKYVKKHKNKNLENSKKWQKENKEKAYANHAKYRENNRERVNLISKASRERAGEDGLERRRKRSKERKTSNPIFKMSENIRSLIIISFKKKDFIKKSKTEQILGCSLKEFSEYILSLCPEGVTLKDFGRYGYQIDHVIPISSAKTEEEIVRLNHYTNLQPLFWRGNISKRDKIINITDGHLQFNSFCLQSYNI